MRSCQVTAFATAILATALLAAPCQADPSQFGLASVAASLSTSEAGAHPDFTTEFEVATDPASEPNAFGLHEPYAATRDAVVGLPPGLIGDPNAVTQCALAQLETFLQPGGGCPNSSQVGVVTFYAYALTKAFSEPLYMMRPPSDESAVARLGFIAYSIPTYVSATLRSGGDYGIDAEVEGASGQQRVVKVQTTLWGVPAAKAHDTERQTPVEAAEGATDSPSRPPGGTVAPLMTNPTRCRAPLQVSFSVDSYQEPGRFAEMAAALPEITGCEQLAFSPAFSLTPTSRATVEPMGLDADLTMAQNEAPEALSTSQLRYARVTLPMGMTISPGAGDGLAACSAEEVGLDSSGAAHCPDAAKIGTAQIVSPALSRPVTGAVYQRTPLKGNLFGIWLVADELGLHLKLPGEVHVNPETGQIETVFEGTPKTEGLPQAPVSEFKLHFRSGPRAPLAAPQTCGTYFADYEFVPWSGNAVAKGSAPMTFDQGCAGSGFAPKLSGGSVDPLAGAFASFLTTLTRESGEQNVSTLDVSLPPGLLAKLAGVPLCEGGAAETGDCPAASQVGSALTAVGPGPAPLWLPQPGKDPISVYLSGPYRGAPYGLVVRAPAEAGPFDLGTVVTRAAIYVDPETARASVRSDPLPQILEGVPISYRTIHVAVDRPGFTLNPTSCGEKQIQARVSSIQGAVATPSARFQVGGCGELPFKPALSIRLFGKANRGAHPRLTATLRARPGDANIGRAQVALPSSEFLEQGHIQTICTRVQFAASQCPEGSIYGHARAVTPLLDGPLEGPVYLRSSSHELPDLVIALRGQVELDLVGRIDSIHRGIRTTFETVPDAPVTSFTLSMDGGAKSLLANSTNLCASAHRAQVRLLGQNGRRDTFAPVVKSPCGARARKHRP